MAVYVDNEQIEWRGKLWCHLVADSLDELHSFASRIGLRRSWFQDRASFPHYDVTTAVRERALSAGAVASRKAAMLIAARKLKAELAAGSTSAHPAEVASSPSSQTLSLF
jgi:hypothetical protein